MRFPGEARAGWIVAAVVLVNWGLITHGTFAGSGDEPHYLLVAHSLAFDGDLNLANDYRDATLITTGTLQPEQQALWHEGLLRSVHDIGLPVLFAPAVAVAYRLAEYSSQAVPASWLRAAKLTPALLLRHQISLLMAVLTSLMAVELFRCFAQIDPGGRPALWAILIALSPPVLAHSFLFFTEILSATMTVAVFRRLTFSGFRGNIDAAAAGCVTGLLFLVHARNAGLVAGLSLLAIAAFRRQHLDARRCGLFLAGVAVGVAIRTAVNYHLWQTLLTTPIAAFSAAWQPAVMGREIFVRLTGLIFDREFGLLAYAPLYLLAGAGLALTFTSRRSRGANEAALTMAGYLIPVLLPALNIHGWTGGWSPAARFLVPIVPLAAVLAYGYAASAPKWVLWPIVGLQVTIDAFVWQFPKTLWNDGDGVSAFPPANLLPSWMQADATYSFGVLTAMSILICAALANGRILSGGAEGPPLRKV